MKQPLIKLNGIEYLLLVIQANPGKPQRHYLRRKHMYQYARPDYHKGGTGSGYFNSSSYRNVTWCDISKQDVWYSCMSPVDGSVRKNGYRGGVKSKCSQMHLTKHGWHRANKVRQKIGLEPIPFVQIKWKQ